MNIHKRFYAMKFWFSYLIPNLALLCRAYKWPMVGMRKVLTTVAGISFITNASCDHISEAERSDVIDLRPIRDFERVEIDSNTFFKNHALHETLNGKNMIEVFEVYKKINNDEIHCIVRFGGGLNGHPNVVHGGLSIYLFC